MDQRRLLKAGTLGILSLSALGLLIRCVAPPDNPKPAASNKRFRFMITYLSFAATQKESPASPLAGDSFADVLNGVADFSFCLTERFLQLSFGLLLIPFFHQVAVTS